MKQTLRISRFLLMGVIALSASTLQGAAALDEALAEGIGKAFAQGVEGGLAEGADSAIASAMKASVEGDTALNSLTSGIQGIEDAAGTAAQAALKEEMSTFAQNTLKDMAGAEESKFFVKDAAGNITGFSDEGVGYFKQAIKEQSVNLSNSIEQEAISKMVDAGISQDSAEALLGSLRGQSDVIEALQGGAYVARGHLDGVAGEGEIAEIVGLPTAQQAAAEVLQEPTVIRAVRKTTIGDRVSQFGGRVQEFFSTGEDVGRVEKTFSTKFQAKQYTEAVGKYRTAVEELEGNQVMRNYAERFPGEDGVFGTYAKDLGELSPKDVTAMNDHLSLGKGGINKVAAGKFEIVTYDAAGKEFTIQVDNTVATASDDLFVDYLKRAVKNGDVEITSKTSGEYKIEIKNGLDEPIAFVKAKDLPTEEDMEVFEAAKEANYNDMLKASTNIRKMARFFVDIGEGIYLKVTVLLKSGGELLIQALVFTLPNILYQQTVGAEQKAALLETIGDIQKFGNLYLQIPPPLISHVDPLRSIFIYVQVPGDNGGKPYGAEYFTPDVLKNASFFVSYGGSYGTWGSTYIGSSTFIGQMVCLNNGWIFTGDGISVDAENVVVSLRPEGLKTVETFLNTMVAGEGSKKVHEESPMDWVPLGIQQALGVDTDPEKGTQSLPEDYVDLFATHPVSNVNNSLPGASEFARAPIVFARSIERFRAAVSLPNFGGLRLTEMRGLGFRASLLSPDLDLSSADIQAALKNLKKAQDDYDAALSGDGLLGGTSTLKNTASQENVEQETAAAALAVAQQQVARAIMGKSVDDALLGFHPEDDICTRQFLYIYQVVNDGNGLVTPTLSALAKKSGLPIAPTEYVVCLDGASQIIPLLIPAVVKVGTINTNGQAGSSDEDASYGVDLVINPNIQYVSSLTTGITWQRNTAPSLVPILQNGAIDYTKATNVFNTLLKELSSESKGILNQIIGMANYLSKEITEGPFATTGGHFLERIPLEKLTAPGDSVTQAQALSKDMSAILAGIVSASGAEERLKTFGADQQQQLLPNVYIYKVTNKNGQGALAYTGSDGKLVDVPDYIIPVVVNSTNTKFQIVPLGVNPLTGTVGTGNTFYFSLVTGKAYDADYNLLERWYTVDVVPRNPTTYFPIDGSTSGSYEGLAVGDTPVTLNLPVKNATTGSVTMQSVQVKMFPHIPLSTAYMPTVFNPYNSIPSNSPEAQSAQAQYDQALQTIMQKSEQLTSLQKAFAGVPVSVIQFVLSSAQNGQVSAATLKAAGFPNPDVMANTANAYLANNATGSDYVSLAKALTDAQNTLNTLEYIMNTTPGMMIPRTVGTMNIPPLYYLFFSNFEICTSGGTATFTIPASVDSGNSLKWANMEACKVGQPLGKTDQTGSITYLPLAALLPSTLSGFNLSQIINPTADGTSFFDTATDDHNKSYMSIRAAYEKWALGQEAANYWSQTALMGPLNFTQRQKNNVYISATRENVSGGFFFYSATGFPTTSVFVCATGSKDGNVTNIDQLADIGKPYQPGDGTGVYLIDVGTGLVYKPYGTSNLSMPSGCVGINCSLQPVGQNQLRLDLDEIVRRALTNQGHAPTTSDLLSGLPQALQDQIRNAQAAAKSQMAAMMSVTFGGMNLSLNTDQINRGSYVYAEGSGPYMQAGDYFAVFVPSLKGDITQIGATPITDATTCIVSLVTGIKYYRTGAPITDYFAGRVEQPNLLPGLLFSYLKRGNYNSDTGTYVAVDPGNDLIQRVQELNLQYLAALEAAKAAHVPTVLDTVPVLTPAMVASAVSVGGAGKNLYRIGSKYFLKTQVTSTSTNANGDETTIVTDVWFDFNATTDAKDAALGVYYIQQTDAAGSVSYRPMNPISEFTLKAVRLHYGVTVAANGAESLNMPVEHLSIPLAPNEKTLVPVDGNGAPQFGQDGGYMKYQNRKTVDTDRGLTYWYYYDTNVKAYFALIQDTVGSFVEDDPTINPNAKAQVVFAPPYFAEFSSGNEYYLNGQPRMQKVTAAYARVVKPFVWPYQTFAPQLPLDQLASAQPVAGKNDLYFVNGKYYAKEVIDNGPVIDQNGNPTAPLVRGTITRWIDFNGNIATTPVTGQDSGIGSYYQILRDQTSQTDKAIPMSNIGGSFVKNLRRTYGVVVASDGTQTLVDPVVNGVDLKRPLFVWSEPESYQSFGALNVIGDLDDTGRSVFYFYVPYYSTFQFIDSAGSTVTELYYGQDTSSDPLKLSVIKRSYPVSDTSKVTTVTVQDFTSIDQAATVYRNTISDLTAAGNVLYTVLHYISQYGIPDDARLIAEGVLSPKTYIIGGVPYVEGGYPYQTVFSDAPGDKAENDALLFGTPFVAGSKGSRAAGSTDAPTGTSQYGTPLCGVVDNNSLMLGFIPSSSGLLYRTDDPMIGAPNTYTVQDSKAKPLIGTTVEYSTALSDKGVAAGQYFTIHDANGSQESVYDPEIAYLPDPLLQALHKDTNLVSTPGGFVLESRINSSDLQPAVTNLDAGSMSSTYVKSVTVPSAKILYQVPTLDVVTAYYQSNPKKYPDSKAALDNYNESVGLLTPGMYVDYVNGAVFSADGNTLYPNGLGVGSDGLVVIKDQFGGAVAGVQNGVPQLTKPSAIPASTGG